MDIRIDLHTHTVFSDGRNTVKDNIRVAEALELEVLAITDHVFRAEDFTWLDELKNIIRVANSSVKVLAGAEVHIRRDGTFPLSQDELSLLDLVVAESYVPRETNLNLTKREFLEIVEVSIEHICKNKLVDVLAHPLHLGRTIWLKDFREIGEDFLDNIASILADSHVAVEVMNQMYWWYPEMTVSDFTEAYTDFIRKCQKKGCRFSIGSDAHSAGAVGNIAWSLKVLEKANVSEEDIIVSDIIKP